MCLRFVLSRAIHHDHAAYMAIYPFDLCGLNNHPTHRVIYPYSPHGFYSTSRLCETPRSARLVGPDLFFARPLETVARIPMSGRKGDSSWKNVSIATTGAPSILLGNVTNVGRSPAKSSPSARRAPRRRTSMASAAFTSLAIDRPRSTPPNSPAPSGVFRGRLAAVNSHETSVKLLLRLPTEPEPRGAHRFTSGLCETRLIHTHDS